VRDAKEGLEAIYQRFVTLKDIAVNGEVYADYGIEIPPSLEKDVAKYHTAKIALYEYGWPNAFRREEFRRDIEDIIGAAHELEWTKEMSIEAAKKVEELEMKAKMVGMELGEARAHAEI
jgi:hypothetical protein